MIEIIIFYCILHSLSLLAVLAGPGPVISRATALPRPVGCPRVEPGERKEFLTEI